MRRNGMCPICYIKQFFVPAKPFIETYKLKPVENGAPKTPIMGWSSWNTFRNRIDEQLILDTAKAIKESGLYDAGYRYVNLDDNWHSSERTVDGKIQGDPAKFPSGIKALIAKLNEMGFKGGLYSSNGTLTCEDLPASLYREALDARTFAEFGAEYLKYDYCHHEIMSKYAPIVYGIEISADGKVLSYDCKQAKLSGNAKFMKDDVAECGFHVSGLDKNSGYMEYEIEVENAGEYVLTICVRKMGSKYKKCLAALINNDDIVIYDIPAQKKINNTARFQKKVTLNKGKNVIRLFNPVTRTSDSTFLQYYNMGKELAAAAKERPGEFKPIVYSICEWGWNSPYKWGALAGNMWRTTPDIRPWFFWIKLIYGHTIKLYGHTAPGHYNDPDMLEVGNGNLTYNQNLSHFSLWCMMSAPLVLGNDIRIITKNVIDIVTNKDMIAIDQDELYKPAKRIVKGTIDVLARPLSGDRTAICLFNRAKSAKSKTIDLKDILSDPYVNGQIKKSYKIKDVWADETFESDGIIKSTVDSEGVKVYIVE